MQIKKRVVLIMVLAIVLLVFMVNKSDKDVLAKQSQSTLSLSELKPVAKLKKEKVVLPHEEQGNVQNNEVEIQRLAKNLSQLNYLQLYKKRELARDCNAIYYHYKSAEADFDYVQEFIKEIRFRSKKRQQKASEEQIESFAYFVEECLQLEKETYALHHLKPIQTKGDNQPVFVLLTKQMLRTTAITQEETTLKLVIEKAKDFFKLYDSFMMLNLGEQKLDDKEQEQINQEIMQLRSQLRNLIKENSLAYQTDSYKKLLKQLKSKVDELQEGKWVDETEMLQIKSQMDVLLLSFNSKIKTPYAPVFKELFKVLDFNDEFTGTSKKNSFTKVMQKKDSGFLPISERIYQQTFAKDKKYYNHLITPVMEMYLCYLGENCDSDSPLVRNKCSVPQNSYMASKGVYHEACGLTLEEFYFQLYLSPSQIEDANHILNYLVTAYAP